MSTTTALVLPGRGEVFDPAQVAQVMQGRRAAGDLIAELRAFCDRCDDLLRAEMEARATHRIEAAGLCAEETTGRATWEAWELRAALAELGVPEERLSELFRVELKPDGKQLAMLERRQPNLAEVIDRHRTRGRGSIKVTPAKGVVEAGSPQARIEAQR